MNARDVQRLLERIYGSADTADYVGSKNIETIQHAPRLRDETKTALAALYREHAWRVQQLHSSLGLALCDAVQNDLDDDAARGALDLMRANLQTLNDAATQNLSANLANLR
jgi:1,2-phenylacetyl-CoA epoxidase catalytic subunit